MSEWKWESIRWRAVGTQHVEVFNTHPTHTYVRTYLNKHMYIPRNMQTNINIQNRHIRMQTHTNRHICTYVCMYVHTYVHTMKLTQTHCTHCRSTMSTTPVTMTETHTHTHTFVLMWYPYPPTHPHRSTRHTCMYIQTYVRTRTSHRCTHTRHTHTQPHQRSAPYKRI